MVTIYALINPFNNEPFYVGSTVNPTARLKMHITCKEGTKEKRQLVEYIRNSNKRIELLPLLVCSEMAAAKCEHKIYELLIKAGYCLYNDRARANTRQRYYDPNHWLNQPYSKPFKPLPLP